MAWAGGNLFVSLLVALVASTLTVSLQVSVSLRVHVPLVRFLCMCNNSCPVRPKSLTWV